MLELAKYEARVKYAEMLDMRGVLFGAVVALLSFIVLYSEVKRVDWLTILISVVVALVTSRIAYAIGLLWTFLQRLFWVGYLKLNIAYRNGVAQDCLCVNIESMETREHYVNLHFNSYGLKTSTEETKNKYTGFSTIYEQKRKLTMLEIWRVILNGSM